MYNILLALEKVAEASYQEIALCCAFIIAAAIVLAAIIRRG